MLKLGTYEAWFDGEVIVPGDTLQERLANLEAWGYQGIQLWRGTMEMGWPAIKKVIDASNIQLCFAGGGGNLLAAAPDERRQGVERLKRLRSRAGRRGIIVKRAP